MYFMLIFSGNILNKTDAYHYFHSCKTALTDSRADNRCYFLRAQRKLFLRGMT